MKRLAITLLVLCGAAWGTACPSGYSFSTTYNIPPNAVFGGSNLTNIPMLFTGGATFKTVGNGGSLQSSTGIDLVFCDSTGTTLVNYELVVGTYSATTGVGEWYVQVPTLSVSAVTTLTIVYGKSGAADSSSASGTWNNSYKVVNHFGTSGTLTLTDSTGNCSPTNTNSTASAGFLGTNGGAAMNGTTAFVSAGCQAAATVYTVESWSNSSSASGSHIIAGNMNSANTTGFLFLTNAYGYIIDTGTSTGLNSCTTNVSNLGIPSLATSTWQHEAFTYDGVNATLATSYKIYVNGQPQFCGMTGGTHGTTMGAVNSNLLYGEWTNASFHDFWNGTLDEIRTSSVARTQGWIQTEWFNMTFTAQSYYLGSVNTIPTTAVDQMPQPLQFSDSNGVFPNNLTSGSSILVIGRATGVPSTPTGCGASYTLVDSNTAGTAVNPYIWLGTGGSGACTVSITGITGYHALELPTAMGSTVDAHNNGSLAVSGQILTTALTTATNGTWMFCFLTTNGVALTTVVPTVSNASPQWTGLTALSGTNATLAEEFAYTGTNGSYYCPFDNYIAQTPGTIASAEEFVTLAIKPSAITIDTASLPTGSTSSAYSYTLQARGGAGAYTWSVSSGSLPSGLTLNSNGVITGAPSGASQTFTVQVTDGTHTTTKSLTLTVNSSASSCTVSSSSSNTGNVTVSLGTVTSGNLITVGTLTINDFYTQMPTDTLTTPFKYLGTITSRGIYITYQLSLFQGVATSTGSDSVTSVCGGGTCYTAAAQLSGCQTFFDNTSNLIAATDNITGTVTLSGIPVLALSPSSLGWAIAASGANNGGHDLNFAAGSGWTGDATSGATGVADMLGEHITGSTVLYPTWGQTLATATTPQQMYYTLGLRPTTTGAVGTTRKRGWVIQSN